MRVVWAPKREKARKDRLYHAAGRREADRRLQRSRFRAEEYRYCYGRHGKSTLDEGGDIPAEIGTTVEITATPYDAEKYPGMEFVEWEIVYPDSFYQKFPGGIPENLQLKLGNAKSAATTFEMPFTRSTDRPLVGKPGGQA